MTGSKYNSDVSFICFVHNELNSLFTHISVPNPYRPVSAQRGPTFLHCTTLLKTNRIFYLCGPCCTEIVIKTIFRSDNWMAFWHEHKRIFNFIRSSITNFWSDVYSKKMCGLPNRDQWFLRVISGSLGNPLVTSLSLIVFIFTR